MPQDESDVFVCNHAEPTPLPIEDTDACVTLFVTGWHSVAPGPLSWPFPNMRAALDAVRKMKNAIEWAIAIGDEHTSVDEARAKGAILIEQRA